MPDKRVVGLTVVLTTKQFRKGVKRFRRYVKLRKQGLSSEEAKLVSLKQATKRGRKELPGYLKEVEKRASERSKRDASR